MQVCPGVGSANGRHGSPVIRGVVLALLAQQIYVSKSGQGDTN